MGDPGWFTALAVDRLVAAAPATSGMSMRIEIQLRIIGDDDSVNNVDELLHLDKSDDRLEAIGLSFSDAKPCWPLSRSALSRPRRRASWPDIGAVTAVIAPC
jgi:hypothetical protein